MPVDYITNMWEAQQDSLLRQYPPYEERELVEEYDTLVALEDKRKTDLEYQMSERGQTNARFLQDEYNLRKIRDYLS